MEGIGGISSRTIQKKMYHSSSSTIIRRRTVLVVHRVLTLNDALPDQITQATSTTAMGATKEELFLQKDSIFGANLGIKQNATQSSFGSSISRVFKKGTNSRNLRSLVDLMQNDDAFLGTITISQFKILQTTTWICCPSTPIMKRIT